MFAKLKQKYVCCNAFSNHDILWEGLAIFMIIINNVMIPWFVVMISWSSIWFHVFFSSETDFFLRVSGLKWCKQRRYDVSLLNLQLFEPNIVLFYSPFIASSDTATLSYTKTSTIGEEIIVPTLNTLLHSRNEEFIISPYKHPAHYCTSRTSPDMLYP